PILERGACERLAHERDLVGRQHIPNHDLHAVPQRIGILPNSVKSTGPVQFSDPMVRAVARQTKQALIMKSKTKIWLGVGAFVVAGVNSAAAETPTLDQSASTIALTRALSLTDVSAAKRGGGEHGEHGERGAKTAKKKQGGEGGEGGEEG